MTKILFFIIVCILFPMVAEGADWVRIDANTDNEADQFYLDMKSVIQDIQNEVIVISWVKIISPDYDSKSRFALNCKKRQFKIIDTVQYDKNENLLKSTHSDQTSEWHGIPPESHVDNLMGIVCEDDKPRTLSDTIIEFVRGYRDWAIKESQKEEAKTND